MNPNVAMNGAPFKEVEKYLNGAKYFIIKSSNFENIQLSIKHSEWATTKANEVEIFDSNRLYWGEWWMVSGQWSVVSGEWWVKWDVEIAREFIE